MNQETLFKQNEKLLYDRAWHYARKYGMDFEDLKSQAFEIFCRAISKYDRRKAKFSTFLYHRLRTLNDYCRSEMLKLGKLSINKVVVDRPYGGAISDEEPGPDEVGSREGNMIEYFSDSRISSRARLEQLLFYQLVDRLSEDTRTVVDGLLYGSFHKPELQRQRSPGRQRIREVVTREWGWNSIRADRVWTELRRLWDEIRPTNPIIEQWIILRTQS